jgi:hypothetical protein
VGGGPSRRCWQACKPLATALYFACLFALLNLMITARQLAFQGRLPGSCSDRRQVG